MFQLPELTYDYDALGKSISRDIMELHHTKHHAGYIAKLNAAVAELGEGVSDTSVEGILRNLQELPESVRQAIRNNGGGHYNHSLFWQCMAPDAGGQPTGVLADDIVKRYGSFQQFVDEFSVQASGVFGSGWAWLMPNLDITTTPNQDSPLMTGGKAPLLGLDVWEHAYYLDYKNVRADYIRSWWDVVNWEFVQGHYVRQ